MTNINENLLNEVVNSFVKSHDFNGYPVRSLDPAQDTVQAVILAAKLKHLDQWNNMRGKNAASYNEQLTECESIVLPRIMEDRTHVFQTYAIRVPNRDEVVKKMQEKYGHFHMQMLTADGNAIEFYKKVVMDAPSRFMG